MRTFILKARKGPADPAKIANSVGEGAHLEIAAHVMMNAFFASNSFRRHVLLHLVFESSSDYSRIITFDSSQKLSLPGFHEEALLSVISGALEAGSGLGKEESTALDPGVSIAARSFESLIKEVSAGDSFFVLDRKGVDIRTVNLGENPCFFLTDHIPNPKNTDRYLQRLGGTKVSVSPRMLFASQCVTLIQNELDRRGD